MHLAVAEAVDRLPIVGAPAPFRSSLASAMDRGAGPDGDPEDRVFLVWSVVVAWLIVALGCGALMIALAFVGHLVAGESGNHVGTAVGLGLGFFCVAGAAYAWYRMLFARAARHRARRVGMDDQRYRKLARLATLHNTSLVGQAVLGVLALSLALSNGL